MPSVSVMTNHPKTGGITSLLTALGTMALAGRVPKKLDKNDSSLTEAFRAGPVEASSGIPKPATPLKDRSRPLPSKGGMTTTQTITVKADTYVDPDAAKINLVGSLISTHCGYPAKFCQGNVNMREVLGMTDSQIQSVIQTVHSSCQTDPEWDVSTATTVADITRWIVSTCKHILCNYDEGRQ